jgi:hypothetical protein
VNVDPAILKGLKSLDRTMRSLLDISAEMLAHQQTLDNIAQKISQGEAVVGFYLSRLPLT